MTEIDIPPQAKKVLDWVIEETGKPLVVNFTEGIGANMAAGFVLHPDKVQIDISPSKSSTEAEIVDNICHEALHGYLIHKSGYHFPEPITNIATEDVYLLSLAGTMIDDIVVDKILEDLHLNPTSSQYIPQVKREIKAMNKGKDIYAESAIANMNNKDIFDKDRWCSLLMAFPFPSYYSTQNPALC
ncbi:MAG: hypothetical protein ACXWMH_02180 [Syntrophales bacterium]